MKQQTIEKMNPDEYNILLIVDMVNSIVHEIGDDNWISLPGLMALYLSFIGVYIDNKTDSNKWAKIESQAKDIIKKLYIKYLTKRLQGIE